MHNTHIISKIEIYYWSNLYWMGRILIKHSRWSFLLDSLQNGIFLHSHWSRQWGGFFLRQIPWSATCYIHIGFIFLAAQNSSIGDLVTHSLSNFYFWHYRVTLETCNLWDIWSEWWRDMIWLKKDLPTNIPTHLPTYLPTYVPPLENTLKERS